MEKINEAGAAPRSPAVAEVLRRGRAHVEHGWMQGAYRRNSPDGTIEAVCAAGAICCQDDQPREVRYAAYALLSEAAGSFVVSSWNDEPGRTQAEVLAAFDKAIAFTGAKPRPSSLGPAPGDSK